MTAKKQTTTTRQTVRARLSALPGQGKYGAKPTSVDGYTFHSQGEARRYSELKLLERAGEITDLKCQHDPGSSCVFDIVVKGQLICKYIADFTYVEKGSPVVEDFKGVVTPVYALKRKLMKAIYGIVIRET